MAAPSPVYHAESPDISHITTEDDTPVDNLASEKQQRLLTEPLYSAWVGPPEGRPFLAAANVGIFPSVRRPPIVPDAFLSLDVEVADDWWAKQNRSYFAWEFGKVPEVVVEIVSNREGGETTSKMVDYARMGVTYYVIYDPQRLLQPEPLRVYQRSGLKFHAREDHRLPDVGLGLVLWEGTYERKHTTWLRFCDAGGNLIPTGAELAREERRRADEADKRADEADKRADEERQRASEATARAEALAARLEELGFQP